MNIFGAQLALTYMGEIRSLSPLLHTGLRIRDVVESWSIPMV